MPPILPVSGLYFFTFKKIPRGQYGTDNQYVEVYHSDVPFDENEFTNEELQILASVARICKEMRTSSYI